MKNVNPISVFVAIFFACGFVLALPHFGIETIVFLLAFVALYSFFGETPQSRQARFVPFYPLKKIKKK